MAVVLPSILALVAVGVFVVWAVHDGGYAPEQWLPGGLLVLGLLCASLASAETRERLWARRVPLSLLGLYVVWSYASIGWAQVRGDAFAGANRTLVYWLVFALFSGLALRRWAGALVLCWGGGLAVAGLIALADAATASDPAGHFVLGRLAAPVGYPDADAALFLSACLTLLVLASRRNVHLVVRAATGAAAVVLADLAVLCGSRGSMIVFPLALLLYLIAARSRARALAHIAVLLAAAAPAVPALLAVQSAVVHGDDWVGAVRHAGLWIGVDAVLAVVAFGLLAALDERVQISLETRRRISRGLQSVAVVALASLAIAVILAHPVSRAETAWHDFTTNRATPAKTLHFASGLGTSRYDVWRIAMKQFLAHPVTGVGADNYLVGYLRERRTFAVSRYPESLELRALSETGLIGSALFFGFLAFALWNAWRAARRLYSPGVPLACLVGCGYWLLHSSVDWFWEYPALAAPAFALLALGGAPRKLATSRPGGRTQFRPRALAWAIGGAAALAAAAAMTLPWISTRLTDQALAEGPTPHAWSLLRTASSLDPYSEQPALAEAELAASAGRLGRESRAFRSALRRNPHDWYAHFMLGIVAGLEHRPRLARAELGHAHSLFPTDNLTNYARKRLAIHEPMSQQQVRSILLEMSAPARGVRQH